MAVAVVAVSANPYPIGYGHGGHFGYNHGLDFYVGIYFNLKSTSEKTRVSIV